jgi:hypothetical protein
MNNRPPNCNFSLVALFGALLLSIYFSPLAIAATANAGLDQIVSPSTTVQLVGSSEGFLSEIKYKWKQLAPSRQSRVNLNNSEQATASFISPALTNGEPITLTFRLTVEGKVFRKNELRDDKVSDEITITVKNNQPPPSFPLTLTTTGSGTGSVLCNNLPCEPSYPADTNLTLTATPDAGWGFTGWGGDCSGFAPCQLTMATPKSVTASFNMLTFSLTTTKTGTGNGTVTSTPAGIDCGAACNFDFASDTSVELTAVADANSLFTGWSDACIGTGCSVTMDADKTVTANFDVKPVYAVTINKIGNGSVTSAPASIDCGTSCSASFNAGDMITLTAVPDAGYTFGTWTGCTTSTEATCTINVTQATQIDATFVQISPPPSGKLNDTGIISCADNTTNGLPCVSTASSHPGQDANFGRDVTNNDSSDGHAGFNFTKIASDGTALLANATAWNSPRK